MKKKGQSEVLTTTLIFELIIGVLIAGILMYAVLNINNASRYSKDYMEYDLFLLKEMVRSLPGDLEMTYNTSSWCLVGEEEFAKGNNCMVKITKTGDKIEVEDFKIGK